MTEHHWSTEPVLDVERSADHEEAMRVLQAAEAKGWQITASDKREGVWVAERHGTKRYGVGVVELAQNIRAPA